MATIALYKNKINGVGSLLDDIIKSSSNLNVQLGTLKRTLQGVDSSTCNLQDTVDSISSSSKSERDKVADLKRLNSRLTEFIEMTTNRDASAKSEIERAKKDFYSKYSYLKPRSEMSKIEKICDSLKKAGEWCKEHWKFIVTVAIVIVAVALLATGVGSGLGAAIIAGACWGAISGAVIGGVAGGINSLIHGGTFFDGFENGAFDGAIGGAIGGAITGGLSFAIGPAATFWGSVGREAGINALSSGVSNMCVTTIDYLAEHKTLAGAWDDILVSGFAGVISGGISGGIMGGIKYNATVKNLAKYGLTVENGKVDGKIPLDKYLKYREMSINNPNSNTMTLGKYEPTILPDGTKDFSIPGPGAYTQKAGDTTFFSLGTEWDNITNTYNLDSAGKDMFKLFNQPALDDAVNAGKVIRFSHDPTAYGDCALKWEWDYLTNNHNYSGIIKMGDFWYGIQ